MVSNVVLGACWDVKSHLVGIYDHWLGLLCSKSEKVMIFKMEKPQKPQNVVYSGFKAVYRFSDSGFEITAPKLSPN